MADPERRTMFALADRLNLTILDIEALPVEVYRETLAYYRVKMAED